jgi:hypothetical protein
VSTDTLLPGIGTGKVLKLQELLTMQEHSKDSVRLSGDNCMTLLSCASVLAVLATSLVPAPVRVRAAEAANAMLKDAKGQKVGSVSLVQTPAGVLLQL